MIRWSLPEFTPPFEHMPALVGLFTGREVDATRGLASFREEDLLRDRERYNRAFQAYHAARGPLPDLTLGLPVAPPPRRVP